MSGLFVSESQDAWKTQEYSNVDKVCSEHDDFNLVPSGKREQFTSSGKQPHIPVCE